MKRTAGWRRRGCAAIMLGLATAAMLAGAAAALQADEILPDAGLETRARAISTEVRCLVCQNQSIDDSDAPLARDLRILVRERLVAGDSDDAVRAFVVRRYGEFVLLRPPFGAHTLLLWLGPALILGAAVVYLARNPARRRGPAPVSAPLSAEEQRRLRAVLESERI
ncbi:MAG: cytochrome biosis family protein [Enterovirga sp.]|jgi:cytochrome c-type biogenesis protein CcmH|nr:cytochrome biosis family protein [Enterovirga sp.]